MSKETIVGKTKKGKEIGFRVKKGDALYTIYFAGGGALPEELTGMWTDARQCEIAISNYLNKDTLLPADQEKKDYKKRVSASKRRPSKLNHGTA